MRAGLISRLVFVLVQLPAPARAIICGDSARLCSTVPLRSASSAPQRSVSSGLVKRVLRVLVVRASRTWSLMGPHYFRRPAQQLLIPILLNKRGLDRLAEHA